MTNSPFFDNQTNNNSCGLSEAESKNLMSSQQLSQSYYIPKIDINDKQAPRQKWKPTAKMSLPHNHMGLGHTFAPYKLREFKQKA